MKVLVAYYSWTGNTARVARAIADGLACDIEEICERRPRSGRFGRLRCAIDSVLRRRPGLAPLRKRLEDYDLVILGCPVWARQMASPMRSFIDANRGCFRMTATFCTEAGIGGELALETVARACGAPTLTHLVVSHQMLAGEDWRHAASDFVRTVKEADERWNADHAGPLPVVDSQTGALETL